MWARIVEVLLGIWLLLSPLMIGSAVGNGFASDLVCGVAAIALALLSFSGRFRRAHFLILLVAAWLVATGYMAGHPAPPVAQSRIITGLLLAMFAIIPNHADQIPSSWKAFYSEKTAERSKSGSQRLAE